MNLFRRTHSAVVRLGFGIFALLLVFPLITAAQSRVEWEVVNPFHFIQDLDAIDELRSVYRKLDGKKTARDLEIALQRKDESAVTDRRNRAAAKCLMIALGKERDQCIEGTKFPYLGWFARLGRYNHAGTCWDSSALKFRDEGPCRDYIESPRHRVRMWVDNPVSTDFPAWKWKTGGAKAEQCNPKYEHPVCIEFEVKTGANVDATAIAPDGSELAPAVPLKVEDVLIAGLGDSYAAGEGNPDVPAQFLERESDTDFVWFWKFRRSPRHDKIDQDIGGLADVAWLDKRCHRSMYSYQFKAALRYALEHPQKSVTFASLSCSGAEIPELIDKPQEPKEMMRGATVYQTVGKRKTIRPQIDALNELLGDRKIDYLLLSIGGNDAGFAKYVAYVMLSGKTLWLARNAKRARRPEPSKVATAIDELKASYGKLNRKLATLKFVSTPGKESPASNRIILTTYPNLFNDENRQLCSVTRDEFSVPFNRDKGRTSRLKLLSDNVYLQLIDAQKESARLHGWSLAEPDKTEWEKHGFCAQKSPLTPVSIESIQERFIMPKRKNERWYSIEPRCNPEGNKSPACGTPNDFDPRDYMTYGRRERWIRLPVDAKLSVDQRTIVWLFSFDILFTDDWSTVMHPTAEGFAVNADSTLDSLTLLEPPGLH